MEDPCKAVVSWKNSSLADGYIVRYGIAPDKLYNSVQVMDDCTCELTGLNRNQSYFLTVDVYNANGLVKGTDVRELNN